MSSHHLPSAVHFTGSLLNGFSLAVIKEMQLSLFLAFAIKKQLPAQATQGYTVWNRLLQREGTWRALWAGAGDQAAGGQHSTFIPAWAVAGARGLPVCWGEAGQAGHVFSEAGTVLLPSALRSVTRIFVFSEDWLFLFVCFNLEEPKKEISA